MQDSTIPEDNTRESLNNDDWPVIVLVSNIKGMIHKERIDKLDFIESICFCSVKETGINRVGENIFKRYMVYRILSNI
jgi:hypothetical protein